jgi:rubrerythrin
LAFFSFRRPQKAPEARNGTLNALAEDYQEELRMVRQFQDHAGKAPYPHFAERLRTLAEEEKKHAELLRERILSLGGSVEEKEIETKTGWNHWQRLVVDLGDEQMQEKRYQDQAIRYGARVLNLRELLLELAEEEAHHIGILRDLILRSDPQAGH